MKIALTRMIVSGDKELLVTHTRRMRYGRRFETTPTLVSYPLGSTVEFSIYEDEKDLCYVDPNGWIFSCDALTGLQYDKRLTATF